MPAFAVHTTADLSISANAQELRRVALWLETCAQEYNIPAEQLGHLDLCAHEIIANILEHGSAEALAADIRLHLDIQRNEHETEATITIADAGIAFNPLTVAPKALPETLAEAQPGGLGLTMMHAFSDSLSYAYEDGRNQLTFSVSWK